MLGQMFRQDCFAKNVHVELMEVIYICSEISVHGFGQIITQNLLVIFRTLILFSARNSNKLEKVWYVILTMKLIMQLEELKLRQEMRDAPIQRLWMGLGMFVPRRR